MKFWFLILCLNGFMFTSRIYSQEATVSLNVSNKPVKEVLKMIENNSNYTFMYNASKINMNRQVDLAVNKAPVKDVLDRLFSGTDLAYRMDGSNIVISENKAKENLVQQNTTASKVKTVTGKVVDESGNALPGVTVVVKGNSKRATITDANGRFSLKNVPRVGILKLSFVGMVPQEIGVENKDYVEVTMVDDSQKLSDVTVVAFAKQKKESVVGSITTIKPAELKIPSSNLTTALAGRLAGIIAYQRSGEPGQDNANFFIRGVTTFGYKKDPLILIDNNESTTEELVRLLPDDIASFSIMKDATATALYGSRGANGVILITTKEGREGNASISIRVENNVSMPAKMVELADPISYMKLHNEAVRTRNPLGEVPYSENKINNTMVGLNPYVYPSVDWYKILFKDYTNNQQANVNISGGGKIAQYYVAGGFTQDNGVLKVDKINNFNSNIDLKRYTLRSNVNVNLTKTTKMVVRLNGSFDDYTGPIDGGNSLFNQVINSNPVLFPPYFKPDSANLETKHVLFGNYDNAQYNNPYAKSVRGYKNYTVSRMSAQFELNQKLDFITPGLFFRTMFNTSRYSYFDLTRQYTPFYYEINTYNKQKDYYTLNPLNELSGTEYLSYSEGGKTVNSTTYLESALNWGQTYKDKHELSGLLVFTMRQYLDGNAGSLQNSLPYRNLGLAGRATYAFDKRYYSEFNFGYNGSERFAAKDRYGFFPSIGFAWAVSNESFWTHNIKKIINRLKLKFTYGYVGNDAIGGSGDRFFYLSNVNMNDGSKASSFGTYANHTLNGVSISRYPNPDITWEIAQKFNYGIELDALNDFEMILDLYKENRSNILMTRSFIPTTMGLQSAIRANVGKASSQGIDLSLKYHHSFGSKLWLTGMGNFTYATSKYTQYEEPNFSNMPWRSRIGYSLNQNWGYIAERLFVDEDEVRNSPSQQFGEYRAGDIKYKDLNGDGKITEIDRVHIGYPTSPEIVYGFGLSAGGWHNFDISCFFQGLARESFWIDANATSPFISNQRALLKAYEADHWSESNRNLYALWPRLSSYVIGNNAQTSTWFMRDGSFLRLKSVEIGYSIPSSILSKLRMKTLRAYINSLNLLCFSKFKLWDPEMGGNGLGYPIQRVFNVGLMMSF